MKSIRRERLDQFLSVAVADVRGIVVDVGGEKVNYRGSFHPPVEQVSQWTIVNIDPESGADIISSANDIPLPNAYADVVILAEVLEHLREPEAALVEAARLLKPEGKLIATMPFMYQVHGDPCDFTRWTSQGLKSKVEETGLTVIQINPMGGTWSVIYDTLRSQLYRGSKTEGIRFLFYHGMLSILKPIFKILDRHCSESHQYITTGWALQARK